MQQEIVTIESPDDVMTRACQVLIASGHGKLADRLSDARFRVGQLVKAAAAGTEESSDRAVSKILWFGPQRATVLRDALEPFGVRPNAAVTRRHTKEIGND